MRLAKLSLLFLTLTAVTAFAGTYQLSINSSSLTPGTSGFIDFGFNGGYPATAEIDMFSLLGGSLDAPSIFTQGTVSGTLPGMVTMSDDNADYDEGLTFGSSLSFLLTLSGTPGGSVGDVFTLSFFNSTFTGGLLTANNSDFWIAQFQMDTLGNIKPTAFDNPAGGPSFATITAIPEPGSGSLFLLGLIATAAFRSIRRLAAV